MKKIILFVLLISATSLLQSCGTLSSTTYIDAEKSFVLGEGNHGSYTAKVKNAGTENIEVFAVNNAGITTSLGILKPNESGKYPVKKNTTVKFENKGSEQGVIKIRAKGDTNLSMGYSK